MKFVKLVKSASGYISKQQLQNAIDNNDENILSMFKAEWIGQGYGYKSNKKWEDAALDEVIYIPECGYNTDYGDGSGYPIDSLCTKQDFINVIKEYTNVKPSRVEPEAKALFEMVDWQGPEGLAYELDYDEDYEEDVKEELK